MSDERGARTQWLFNKGDPAHDLSPALAQRVAARLRESARPRSAVGWGRAAVTLGLLLSSAGLGAALVFAERAAARAVHAPTLERAPRRVVTPTGSDSTAREAAQLQGALEALQARDATEALRRLDALQRDFPRGPLSGEARVARVRALLQESHDAEALRALAAFPLSEVTPELRLMWADALVRAGRCPEALALLSRAAFDADDERAVEKALRARCAP